MSQEIKYRAFEKSEKQMVDVLQITFPFKDLQGNMYKESIRVINKNGEKYWLVVGNYILMQSTGLFDKNGQEVYAGDIIRAHNKKQVVEYGRFYHSDGWEKLCGIGFSTDMDLDDIEVIGNIHENPELLNK